VASSNRVKPAPDPPPPGGVTRAYLEAILSDNGFEPYRDGAVTRLQNCPFHQLARHFPPLICGMNLALIEGIVDGIGDEALCAEMDPAPNRCCVAVRSDDGSKNNEC
jgi:predicted ArsR family transcriptional regulator